MANETTVQTSCIQENHTADECRENIPPGATAPAGTSKLKVQVGDVVGFSSTQLSGENEPLSHTSTFSTPAPASSKAKSRLSGLQSALTPILKYLNIGNKCPSPEPLKHGNNLYLANTTANGQKSSRSSNQHTNSDFSSSHTNAPVCWLDDECLPEITLLDVTCDSMMHLTKNDSTLPDSMPSTPITSGSVKTTFTNLHLSQMTASVNVNTTTQIHKASSVSKSTTETSPVINQSSSAGKIAGLCDVQGITFDRHLNTKPPKQNGKITVSETASSDSHPTTMDKLSLPKVHPPEISRYDGTPDSKDINAKMVDIPESIDAPLRWLDDRYFPEITLLDVTRDSEFSPREEMSSLDVTQDISPVSGLENSTTSSALSGQIVAKPGTLDTNNVEGNEELLTSNDAQLTSKVPEPSPKPESVNNTFTIAEQSSLSASTNVNTSAQIPCPQNRTLDISSPHVSSPKAESASINLNTSGQIPGPQNTTLDLPPSNVNSPKAEMDIKAQVKICPQNTTLDLPPSNVGTPKVETDSLNQVTSVSKSATETSSNINQNCSPLNSSASCDVQNVTFDRHSLRKSTGKTVLGEASTTAFNLQNTFDTKTPSKQNGTITVSETSSSRNNTLDMKSPSKQNGTITVSETSSSRNNTLDMKSPSKQNGTITVSETSSSRNNTLDMKSPSKQNGTITVSETNSSRNNTLDMKSPSKQNGTITVSETSSSDSHQSTLDKPSPPKVCNATSSSKDSNSEVHPPEPSKQNGTTSSEDSGAKVADTPESTFEATPAVEVAHEAGRCETKDDSHSGPMRDRLSDMFAHHSIDAEDNKANTLNLDDTLELRSDSLVTSTPMPNCKMFNFNVEREEGKIIGAQKKLYGDGPSKQGGQVSSDVPSNIICDRKTFFTQPTVKSLLPPLKPPSKLLKFKPASTLPGKFEPLMSGLPMTRQRTQAEALRNTAASDASQATTGISTSYNLRATTAASKLPNPGLRKPALSGIPSGIQRAAANLRPSSARSNAPASSSTDKPRGSTATSPAAKSSQAKKHPLTRGEALPTAKRKKMGNCNAPVPSGSSEASTSSSDATNQPKNLKRPAISQRALPAKIQRDDAAVPASTAETSTSCNAVTRGRTLKPPVTSQRALLPKPQGHGCAKCHVLEQQLEMKSEEIRRLKEELLKYKKQEEES